MALPLLVRCGVTVGLSVVNPIRRSHPSFGKQSRLQFQQLIRPPLDLSETPGVFWK